MAESIPIQLGFNGGIFSRRARGRTDLSRYAFGCEELQNFVPTVQGPVVKRSGTVFVRDCIASGTKSRLIPFVVSDEAAYVLEIGVNKIRFYQSSAAVLESTVTITNVTDGNPVVLTAANSYSAGDTVYVTGTAQNEINGRFFTVANPTGANFELSGEDGTGRTTGASGGTAAKHYDIEDGVSSNSIPWGAADLDAIQFVQTGDLMYLVHPDYAPHQIVRTSATSWTCTEMTFEFPPLATENDDEDSLMAYNSSTGRVTSSGTNAYQFSASDVGRTIALGENVEGEARNGLWSPNLSVSNLNNTVGIAGQAISLTFGRIFYQGRVYKLGTGTYGGSGGTPPVHEEGEEGDGVTNWEFVNWGWGYATIDSVVDANNVNVTVVLEMPDSRDLASSVAGTANKKWAFGAWDDVNGYPTAVAFFEDRLWFGGTATEPQTVWASRTSEYDSFRITPAELDDTGLQFEFLSQTLNKIEWMTGEEQLYAGTAGGEFTIDSGSTTEGITPSTVRVRRRSNYGSQASVQPRAVDNSLLFVRQNYSVHELTFDFDSDRYIAPDVTRLAHDVLDPGVVSVDYARDPFSTVWFVKSDGTLAVLVWSKAEEVFGWSNVILGGTDVIVESLAVIPHPDGDEDQVWVTVARTINGGTVRYVEVLEKFFDENDTLTDAFFVDAGLSYSGAATTNFVTLQHLEGEEVVIVADGARLPNATVTNGAITLTDAASDVKIGLQMGSARVKTLPWVGDGGALARPGQRASGWQGRVVNLILLLDLTGNAVEYGSDFATMSVWDRRKPSDAMDAAVPLFSGYSPILEVPSDWAQTRQAAIRYDEPFPCTICSITAKVETEVR